MKVERERKETVAALERQLTTVRAEVLDWKRELAAAEAERDRLMSDKKTLTKRASSGSLYAGFGGTPRARGILFVSYNQRWGFCGALMTGMQNSWCSQDEQQLCMQMLFNSKLVADP